MTIQMEKDIVFVDTSIFIAENYFAPNNRISSLLALAEKGIISLVSTEITNNEVLRQFKDEVSSAWSTMKNNHKALVCFDNTRSLFYKETKKQLLKQCEDNFRRYIEKSSLFSIGYEYCSDVKSIFEKYFKAEKPFNEGKKKHEFPDAFVLLMLEQYCKRNSLRKIILLSEDKDMKEYESDYLEPFDYKEYITTKLAEATTLEALRKAIENEKDEICLDIKEKLEEKLYDGWNYSSLFYTEDLPEVEIEQCDVDMDSNFSIISKSGDSFLIELNLTSYCEVKCTYFNLDYAVYDREDRMWYGGQWDTETLKGDESFQMLVSYNSKTDDLTIESFEIADAVPNFRHSWDY